MNFKKGQVLTVKTEIELANQAAFGCGVISVRKGQKLIALSDFSERFIVKSEGSKTSDSVLCMWPMMTPEGVKWFYVYARTTEEKNRFLELADNWRDYINEAFEPSCEP